MGNAFGKHKPKVTSKDKAILELKVQRDKLKQYEKKLQTVLDRELQVAKEQLRLKNHHAARLALSKKKYQQSLLEKVSTQLLTLEQLTQSIEFALVEKQVVEGLKQGTQVLSDLNKEMQLEDVEKLMDDSADAVAYQNQVGEMLSQVFSEEDEADVMAELDQLIETQNQKVVQVLPDVPKNDIVEAATTQADTAVDSTKLKSKKAEQEKPAKKMLHEPLSA
ncbi:Vacuolar protein sorting-associated protein 20 [Batrachochytrium dendrobatidis]|nr:Vacuolar protein sorting-associated protein 20 [Batrachochytrium dendrobatidis]KAK5664656.1 Vacuolar protein sorting-associated protein 20 [Batrachochytrium dendrobatidis]